MPEIRTQRVALFLAALAVLGACTPGGGRDTRSITLYTSVTQDTVDAVVEGHTMTIQRIHESPP